MSRLGRLGAIVALTISTSLLWSGSAMADHCPPIDNPDPIPGSNTTYCHTPTPQDTPRPTAKPTAKPTAAPTAAPRTQAPTGPTRTSSSADSGTGSASTPAPTPFDIEVPDEPLETAEIIVDDPIDDTLVIGEGDQAGAASNWVFGFLVGLLVGGILGRMSWGLKRRRRQQIFG